MKCETCRFFAPVAGGLAARGQCRALPPTVLLAPVNTLAGNQLAPIAVWPGVEGNAWCGKFEEGETCDR
jgi:hypothetical protein